MLHCEHNWLFYSLESFVLDKKPEKDSIIIYMWMCYCYVGNRLDSFARHSLWESGLDYLHGTGHGVGSFLNVHEGTVSPTPMLFLILVYARPSGHRYKTST